MKRAISQAIKMDPADQERRMDAMRAHVRHHDVRAWASSFVQRLRRPV